MVSTVYILFIRSLCVFCRDAVYEMVHSNEQLQKLKTQGVDCLLYILHQRELFACTCCALFLLSTLVSTYPKINHPVVQPGVLVHRGSAFLQVNNIIIWSTQTLQQWNISKSFKRMTSQSDKKKRKDVVNYYRVSSSKTHLQMWEMGGGKQNKWKSKYFITGETLVSRVREVRLPLEDPVGFGPIACVATSCSK